MTFNSFVFALFLPMVFLLYWFVFDKWMRQCNHQLQWQNLFIVVASYLFYGWWDWRFLILIAFTSFCSWGSGLLIQKYQSTASSSSKHNWPQFFLVLNIVINLGILGFFKYFNFFVDSFVDLFAAVGIHLQSTSLQIILPVGISFYTFQALSYSIDVYRKKIEPTKDVIAFFAYVSFFPQLVAGPIERATHLLPQILQKRKFDYDQAVDGVRQIFWGLFKKVVVADNCAIVVNSVMEDYADYPGSTLFLVAVLFAIEIYGDFSGYSDIAIGVSKLFGIQLKRNFNVPYFSRDIAEFWRRWHISLNTWFVDYLYIPLGGSRPVIAPTAKHPAALTKAYVIRNVFAIFLLSGLWHGANWTYVMWGLYHALLFIPLISLGKNKRFTGVVAEHKILPSWRELCQMLLTFLLVTLGWVFFRSVSIADAFNYFSELFSADLFSAPVFNRYVNPYVKLHLLTSIPLMVIVEWLHRDKPHPFDLSSYSTSVRVGSYVLLGLFLYFFSSSSTTFIYFQF